MELRPILSAMRRNKVGAILIGVQMAITLAILCNALFIIEQRVMLSKRPTGADESNIFVIANQWVGNPPDLAPKAQGDLAALRSLPGVVDAVASNSFPLHNGGSTDAIKLNPEQKDESALTAVYAADEHALQALGLKLVAGRNFNSDEVLDKEGFTDVKVPAALIITRILADKLFPGKSAVGQSVLRAIPIKYPSSASSINCRYPGPGRAAGAASSMTIRPSCRSASLPARRIT
jgi:putative ABC transport system permease protein